MSKPIPPELFITPEDLLKYGVKSFYQITGIANLESIFNEGLLPHDEVSKRGLATTVIADNHIMQINAGVIELEDGKFAKIVHKYVRTYFNPRNAMMYRVKKEGYDICIVCIDPKIILDDDSIIRFTDRIAVANDAKFFTTKKELNELDWCRIFCRSWNGFPDQKDRKEKMMAEFQIRPKIPAQYITKILVPNHFTKWKLDKEDFIVANNVRVTVNQDKFFE